MLCVGTFVVVILGKRTRRYVHTCFRRGRNKHRCPKSWVRVHVGILLDVPSPTPSTPIAPVCFRFLHPCCSRKRLRGHLERARASRTGLNRLLALMLVLAARHASSTGLGRPPARYTAKEAMPHHTNTYTHLHIRTHKRTYMYTDTYT